MVNKLELRERAKIATWADATRLIASPKFDGDVNFLFKIIEANTTIPVILTDENGIVKGSRNLDSTGYNGNNFMRDKIKTMELENEPIEIEYIAGQNIKIFYASFKKLLINYFLHRYLKLPLPNRFLKYLSFLNVLIVTSAPFIPSTFFITRKLAFNIFSNSFLLVDLYSP